VVEVGRETDQPHRSHPSNDMIVTACVDHLRTTGQYRAGPLRKVEMDKATEADMKQRTPKGWYGLAAPKGWDVLVKGVHEALLAIDPDYEIYQIKEKFGGLRYYCSLHSDEARDIIRNAETLSYTICQDCGAGDASITSTAEYWKSTLCSRCVGKYEVED